VTTHLLICSQTAQTWDRWYLSSSSRRSHGYYFEGQLTMLRSRIWGLWHFQPFSNNLSAY